MKRCYSKNQLLEVTWEDTTSEVEWTPDDAELEDIKPTVVRTIGYFHPNKNGMLLKHSLGDGTDYTIIPYGCIVHITILSRL